MGREGDFIGNLGFLAQKVNGDLNLGGSRGDPSPLADEQLPKE